MGRPPWPLCAQGLETDQPIGVGAGNTLGAAPVLLLGADPSTPGHLVSRVRDAPGRLQRHARRRARADGQGRLRGADLDRHAARRPAPRLRLPGRRDAGDRRLAQGRDPVRERLHALAADAAGARLAAHGPAAAGARGAQQHRLPARAGARDAGRGAARPRLCDRRRGVRLRAAAHDRHRRGLRLLRRRRVGRGRQGRRRGAAPGPRDGRARPRLGARRPGPALLPVPARLRAAHALDAARRRARPLRRDLRGRGRRGRCRRRRAHRRLARPRTLRRGARGPRLGPRRGALGPRRAGARHPALSRGAPRAADPEAASRGARRHERAVACGAARPRSHARRGARAPGSGGGARARPARRLRAHRRPASTARPTTRASTWAGASCARSPTRATS